MADPTRGDFPASWYAPQAVSRFSSTSWPASAMQYAKNGQSVKCSLASSTPSIGEGVSPELTAARPSLAQAGCNNSLSDHQKRNVLLYLSDSYFSPRLLPTCFRRPQWDLLPLLPDPLSLRKKARKKKNEGVKNYRCAGFQSSTCQRR